MKGHANPRARTCQATVGYNSEGHATLCGKPSTHHIPEPGDYAYKETDTHLCEAHADEAASSGQNPIRRWRPRPS